MECLIVGVYLVVKYAVDIDLQTLLVLSSFLSFLFVSASVFFSLTCCATDAHSMNSAKRLGRSKMASLLPLCRPLPPPDPPCSR